MDAPASDPQPTPQDKGVTGLANMRNTCYLNATLQAVRHNTELSAFFLENKYQPWIERKAASPKVELVKGYADLLRSLWSASKPAYVRPTGFLQSMLPAAQAAGFDQFLVPQQHDSHEFLVFLLDQLHEGMAEEVNIQITRPTPTNDRDKAIQNALEAWKRFFMKQYSPLSEMIYGLKRITIVCQACRKHSDNWETFNCLQASIPQRSAELDLQPPCLEDLLRDEFKEETIEDYACDHCKPTRTTAIRKQSLWRLPRMMCLSIRRFANDGRKIHTKVRFPSATSMNFGYLFSEDSPEPSQTLRYEVFAAVDHHGVAGGGHYTAQAKSPLTGKWNMFDDETTMPMEQPHFGESTYMIFLKPVAAVA